MQLVIALFRLTERQTKESSLYSLTDTAKISFFIKEYLNIRSGFFFLVNTVFNLIVHFKVIGLDTNGYGRILGQCQLGAKLFYCMWETIARKYDTFTCQNFVAPDLKELQSNGFEFKSLNDVHKYMKQYILGKANKHLVEVNRL